MLNPDSTTNQQSATTANSTTNPSLFPTVRRFDQNQQPAAVNTQNQQSDVQLIGTVNIPSPWLFDSQTSGSQTSSQTFGSQPFGSH